MLIVPIENPLQKQGAKQECFQFLCKSSFLNGVKFNIGQTFFLKN